MKPASRLGSLVAAAALSAASAGCSTVSKTDRHAPPESPRTPSTATGPTEHHDPGNSRVLDFGHPANPSDKRSVTTLVTHYYLAAASENGTAACSSIRSTVAKSVPEDYGQAPGPTYMRGKTCPAVMHSLFAYLHHLLVTEDADLEVTKVRLKPSGGYAVLNFGDGLPEREVNIVREGHTWKLSSLLDSELF